MNIEKLTKNVVKPYFTNNIFIASLSSYISILPDFNNTINVSIKLTLSSKESNLNDVNILELIQWINSFDYIKVIHWDDDKEFDFSNVEKILLIVNFDYKKYYLDVTKIKYNNFIYEENTIKKLIEFNQSDQLTKYFNDIFYNFSKENNIF